MPSKRSRRAERQGGGSSDLLSFFSVERDVSALTTAQTTVVDSEEAVLSFIKGKGGKVTKSELYEWAKKRELTPAALYRALSKMVKDGIITKKFDENSQELSYVIKSS